MKKIIKPKEEKINAKEKHKNNNDNLPAWFTKENDIDATTTEEIEELDRILNDLV